ncbi:protein of unknown function (DUF955) [Frankia sp. EI5c]|nr:protein of unknown function (DUF955) [Frankia sp. EI5c]
MQRTGLLPVTSNGLEALGHLVSLVEQTTGIDVAVLDAGPDEHGLTVRDPLRNSVFIGVARTDRPMRQRSTLAHELAHVLFEDWSPAAEGTWSERRPEEVRADAFARHLLIPVEGLREFLGDRGPQDMDLALLSQVTQRFLVSTPIAAIALEQAGYITEAVKAQWRAVATPWLAARFGWIDQYRALQAESDRRRAPQRLLARDQRLSGTRCLRAGSGYAPRGRRRNRRGGAPRSGHRSRRATPGVD